MLDRVNSSIKDAEEVSDQLIQMLPDEEHGYQLDGHLTLRSSPRRDY